MSNQSTQAAPKRETFSGRKAFLMAAIGSAVGLGNIWRFPYTTYENGGGAFIIPYIIALLTAGIPLLFRLCNRSPFPWCSTTFIPPFKSSL